MADKVKKKKINSRNKGAQGERDVANLFKDHGFPNARRGQQYSGANGDADVMGAPDIHIEVKRLQSMNIHKVVTKNNEDKKENDYGVVIHRKDKEEWLVTMTFEEWMDMYKRYLLTT